MSTSINYPFTTDTNYTFNSSLIEVSGGVAKLKDLTPTDSTFHANFTSDINGNWGDGILTGTATGGASVSGGFLALDQSDVRYVDYDADLNADSQQVGCFNMIWKPNYTGAPANTQYPLSISKADSDTDNLIQISHSPGNNIQVVIRDSAGSILVNTSETFVVTSSVSYELELNYDLTTGATRLFIDGTQIGTTDTSTGTRDSLIALFRVGSDNAGASASNFTVDRIIVYSTVQHTANYTPGPAPSAIKYSLANPTIVTNTSFTASELESFVETSTKTGSDEIKHIIPVNGVDKYIVGGSVATSDGTYAQSNTATEANTDIDEYITARSTIKIKSFLHSDDGNTTPELDLLVLTFNSALPDPTLPSNQDLEGFIFNITAAKANLEIKIRPFESGFVNQGIFQLYEYETIGTTDSNGFFEGTVLLNPSSALLYDIKIGKQSYTIDISNATGIINLSTLTLVKIEE